MSKRVNFRPNLFLLFLSTPYLSLIRSVLAPYILHSEVPLDEESTGLVRSKYILGMAHYGMIEIKNYQWIRYFYIYLRILACGY